jgi:transposase InsO family protein
LGHMGCQNTFLRVRETFYWETYYKDVKNYVKSCELCQKIKSPKTPFKAALTPIAQEGPFERWTVDYSGPVPTSARGNRYIFLAVESTSRYVMGFAVPDQRTDTLARCLLNIFAIFGVPKTIASDRGLSFLSGIIGKLYEILKIKRVKSSSYRPQTQALVERRNRTFWQILRSMVSSHQRDWDEFLDVTLMSMRSHVCTATGLSPYHVLFGRPMPVPLIDQFLPTNTGNKLLDRYVEKIHPKIKILQGICKRNTEQSQQKSKAYYDQSCNPPHFQVGDLVLVHTPSAQGVGLAKKLTHFYKGPFKIISKLNDAVVVLLNLDTLKTTIPINVARLKRFVDRASFTDDWAQDLKFDAAQVQVKPDAVAAPGQDPPDTAPGPLQTAETESPHDTGANQDSNPDVGEAQPPPPQPPEIDKLLKIRKNGINREYYARFTEPTEPKRWLKHSQISREILEEFHSKFNVLGKLKKSEKMKRRLRK